MELKKIGWFAAVLICFLAVPFLYTQENKVRVITDRAAIHAEAHTESYRIEVVRKGTILTLFSDVQTHPDWHYVHYQSPRWKAKVTGFIQAQMVESVSEEQVPGVKELPEEKPPVKKITLPEKSETAQKEAEEKKVAEKRKEERVPAALPGKPEMKETPLRIERSLAATSLPAYRSLSIQTASEIGKNPLVFQVIEPVKPVAVSVEEEMLTAVLPAGNTFILPLGESIDTGIWKEVRAEPLLTFSLGYGPSLGGFGGFLQVNTKADISVHWGMGYYPTSIFYPDYDWVTGKVMFSVGMKYYLPWKTDAIHPYLDLQYGGISVEAVRVIKGIWYYTYIYDDIQRTIWGPSLMAGVELRLGLIGLNGAVGLSYVTTKWEYWDQPFFLTADIGILFYF